MRALAGVLVLLLLPGCAISLHGRETSGGGASTAVTGSRVDASAGAGQARASASFGSPPPARAAGGQVTLSRGASAALVLGLVLAEAVDALGARWREVPPPRRPPRASIADTCSCYGWQPPTAPPE